MEMLSSDDYVALKGFHCPVCNSTRIKAVTDLDVNGETCWQEILCTSCDAVWTDVYLLTGYEDLRIDENA